VTFFNGTKPEYPRRMHCIQGSDSHRLLADPQRKKNLGLGDRVRLLGYRTDTIDLYQAMDLFVLNSLREGLPNVLLEAMAVELPVVATRIAGVPRLVEHETSGLLVDANSDEQLHAALARLLADADLRGRLAACGRRTVEEKFSFPVRMERVRAVYDRVLGHRAASERTSS